MPAPGSNTHLPDSNIHVIRAGEDIAGIRRKAHSHDTLHALRGVHFARVATGTPKIRNERSYPPATNSRPVGE